MTSAAQDIARWHEPITFEVHQVKQDEEMAGVRRFCEYQCSDNAREVTSALFVPRFVSSRRAGAGGTGDKQEMRAGTGKRRSVMTSVMCVPLVCLLRIDVRGWMGFGLCESWGAGWLVTHANDWLPRRLLIEILACLMPGLARRSESTI